MLPDLLHIALLIFAYANVWFLISLALRRNDVADIAWGLGYLLIAGYFMATRPLSETAWWVYAATTIWALRLAGHILLRTLQKKEDFRYRQWRQDWGRSFYWRSWLQVYMLQAAILLIVAAPLIVAGLAGEGETGFWTGFGAGAWLAGFLLETVADHQLARFRRTRKTSDQILQTGVWKNIRHPNYTGEILVWWGLFFMVVALPYGWVAIISPVTITWLLARVSGVPMLEKRYEGNAAYEEYKKRAGALWPKPNGAWK
jgi:steroid 5-alpha reductase family enzyme